jgi:hypothetical protein
LPGISQHSPITDFIDVRTVPETLKEFGRLKFDLAVIETYAGKGVSDRFKESLISGAKTTDEDEKALEKALYAWCAANNCMNYAHW